MNGRIYDPNIGRFLSADPYITFPGNMQSFNRYSYVLNNPLSITDPDGYNPLVAIAIAFSANATATGVATAIFGAAAQGTLGYSLVYAGVYAGTTAIFTGAAYTAMGGTFADGFEAGVINSALAGVSYGIGQSAAFGGVNADPLTLGRGITLQRVVAHGVVGGAYADIQGGKFADGFISSALTKLVSGNISDATDESYAGVFIAATIGGTISELAGGKFANGATAAAFGYMYNQLARTAGKASARLFVKKRYGAILKSGNIDLDQNAIDAKSLSSVDFASKVASKGAWDYKWTLRNRGLDSVLLAEFGNFHFGLVSAAHGFSLYASVLGAGAFQSFVQGGGSASSAVLNVLSAIGGYPAYNENMVRRSIVSGNNTFGDKSGDSFWIMVGWDGYHAAYK